jgi:hypothetical protein
MKKTYRFNRPLDGAEEGSTITLTPGEASTLVDAGTLSEVADAAPEEVKAEEKPRDEPAKEEPKPSVAVARASHKKTN